LKEILYEHKILTLLNQNNTNFLKYFGLFQQKSGMEYVIEWRQRLKKYAQNAKKKKANFITRMRSRIFLNS